MTTQGGTHLVILVHGWLGNDRELAYLQESMERQSTTAASQQRLVFHSAKCNLKRTGDGVIPGGQRLVEEVKDQIEKIDGDVLLSFVGNSLGGLYARYAIAHMDTSIMSSKVTPFIFCTTATPHLGIGNHTYIPLPRSLEKLAGTVMQTTGRDMFGMTTIIFEMGTRELYLEPLRKFKSRIAMANAFGTDFQVPTATAAFLSGNSDYPHKTLPPKKDYVLSVETASDTERCKENDMSQCLDSLGWTKIFVDVRDDIPLPGLTLFFGKEETSLGDRLEWASKDLVQPLSRFGRKWKLPLGHMVSCANSRDGFNSWFNANGRPKVDQLAQDMLQLMEGLPQQCKSSSTSDLG